MKVSRTIGTLQIVALVAAGTAAAADVRADREAVSVSPTITSVGQLHSLDKGHARDARVDIRGTVTYYDPVELLLFVQDDSGAVFVDTDRVYPVQAGDLVEITGHSAPGYRSEVARDPVLHVLGRGRRYAGKRARFADLVSGNLDCQRVKVTGRVRAAQREQHERGSLIHLDLLMNGGEVQVYIGTAAHFSPEALLGQTIEVEGVVGGLFDKKQQLTGVILYSETMAAIHVLAAPVEQPSAMPISQVDDIFKTRNIEDHSSRVRVQGAVTYFRKGDAAVLDSDGKSVYVQTRQTDELPLGSVVDAYGYASDQDYGPSLRLAAIVPTGRYAEVQPQRVNYDDALSGVHSDDLVTISGVLMSLLPDARTTALVLSVDGHIVRTEIERQLTLPSLTPGSRLEITGICRISPGGPWREPYSFRLVMRSASDIRVVSAPSWWTVGHLLVLLAAIGALGAVIAAWALILRRRVKRQTRQIERAMAVAHERSRALEMLSSNRDMMGIINGICASITHLLPGTSCALHLVDEKKTAGWDEDLSGGLVCRAELIDSEESLVGCLLIKEPASVAPKQDAPEIIKGFVDLALLAVRQSTFHQSLLHHSTHDSLTNLPNRRVFERKLSATIQQAEREEKPFAIINIDVNRFKQVNDRYGHDCGDRYLIQISSRLQQCLRGTDTLSRVGGDEFMALASPITTSDATLLIERLRETFTQVFQLDSATFNGSASFGLAMYPQDGNTAEDLKRHADKAMYVDKTRAARGAAEPANCALLTPEELTLAMYDGRCRLLYQPQFSSSGKLTGLEALLRVEDPVLGILPPSAFIDAAEQSDAIIEVGEWVLRQALQDATRWGLHLGEHTIVAVNVASRQAEQADYADRVISAIREINFPPERLELELVERSLAEKAGNLNEQLQKLRHAGVRISIDDFGAGESCLAMLHRLPIDTIKLDRGFFSAIQSEPQVMPVLQAISTMAHSLNKRVVAEGIELEEVMLRLPDELGMDYQGFLFSRPMLPVQIDDILESWRKGIKMPLALRSEQAGGVTTRASEHAQSLHHRPQLAS